MLAGRIFFSIIVVYCTARFIKSDTAQKLDYFLTNKDIQVPTCTTTPTATVRALARLPFNILTTITRLILSSFGYIGIPLILLGKTAQRLMLFLSRKYTFSEFVYVTFAESALRLCQLLFTVYVSRTRPAALFFSLFLVMFTTNLTISDILRFVPDDILMLWCFMSGVISFPFYLVPDMNVIIDMWLSAESFQDFVLTFLSCYRYITFSMRQHYRSMTTRWEKWYQNALLVRFDNLFVDSEFKNIRNNYFQERISAWRDALSKRISWKSSPHATLKLNEPVCHVSRSFSTTDVTKFICDSNGPSVSSTISRSCSLPRLIAIDWETNVQVPSSQSYLRETGIQLSKFIILSPLHHDVITLIAKHHSRISLFDNSVPIENIGKIFQSIHTEEHLNNLLHTENVKIVSISYKHTRIGNNDPIQVSNDRRRVLRCLKKVCDVLSIHRVLFWCDLVYPSPDLNMSSSGPQIPWAKQGIDPYLLVPAIRMISEQQKEEISSSFWMNVERVASVLSGGFITYHETHGDLMLESRDRSSSGNILEMLHQHCAPFDDVKFILGAVICSPILYYKKARYESDKDLILKYGIENALSKFQYFEYIDNTENETTAIGSRKIRIEDRYLGEFLKMITITIFSARNLRLALDRSTEYFEYWDGMASFFPALNVLNEEQRGILEEQIRNSMKVRRLEETIDDLSQIVCQPLHGSSWCNTLVVAVEHFLEGEEEVNGCVKKFRLASEEEEHQLRHLAENLYKKVNFH